MEITLNEKKGKSKISFSVQFRRLGEAIATCNLGIGNVFAPIVIDGFVTINDYDLDTFYGGETIRMEFDSKTVPRDFQVVCCKINNVGKEYNSGSLSVLNPWDNIFVKNEQTLYLPDGSLCIMPEKNVCEITVMEGVPSYPDKFNYISYSIIFSLNYLENDELRKYYFIIDPLLKISSNPPNGGNV